MTDLRVTALIDTFNHEAFIEEAIESVLAQDFPADQLEVLVVDDGSSDRTAEVVGKYSDAGCVRYIHKPNGGQASAFNVGFKHARGEIVALLDGDDVWLPQKLRRVAEEFDRHPEIGMVYHPYENWDMQRNVSVKEAGFAPISGDVIANADHMLRYGNFGTCGMAVRRNVVQILLPVPEDLVIFADTYLIYLIVFLAPVTGIAEHLTRYRHYGGNLAAYGGADRERLRRRWSCYDSAVRHIRVWLEGHGYDVRRPDLADFLDRHRLVAELFGFSCEPPSRLQFFHHMRTFERLYARFWSLDYRIFRALASLAGLVLGYRAYESLRNVYRRAGVSELRELILPARVNTAGASSSSPSAGAPAS